MPIPNLFWSFQAGYEYSTFLFTFGSRNSVGDVLPLSGNTFLYSECLSSYPISQTNSKVGAASKILAQEGESKASKSIPFLKEQQELAAMFEPEKVAHYFRDEGQD